MFKTLRIAALLGLSAFGISNAYAGAGASLSECYDIVIAACNKGDRPQSCSSQGMGECDKLHPKPMILQPGLVFGNAPTQPGATAGNNLKQMGIATFR